MRLKPQSYAPVVILNQMKKRVFIAAAASCAASALWSMPAYPGIIRTTQPDGTEIELSQRGDETFHWAETPDGRTMMRDKDGFWRETDSETLKSRSKAVRAASKPLTQIDGTFPATGERRLLMLLINYADTSPVYSSEDFNAYMNGEGFGGIGSFRDYYLKNSYGALDITTTVSRWITLSRPKSYYGADGAVAMIAEALSSLEGEMDLRQFDNDGDGVLDGLAVIHQGAGQEASGSISDIWSHSSTIYNMEFGGVQVRRYTIQPEILATTGGMSTIGVMCHEFGHNLGAPDFYDTDYSSSGGEFCGTGVWDLMGSGAWNGNKGDRPAGINMWQKIQLGWVTPHMLTESEEIASVAPASEEPQAYRFDTTVPNEYFILENRQQTGEFDVALPSHGLIIYHVSEELIDRNIIANTLNATYPQAVYTVCSGSCVDPSDSPSTFGNVDSDMAPFPGAGGITAFSDRTRPSTKSISGRNSYKALSDITEHADGTVSFRFVAEDAPGSPADLTATAAKGVVTLTWNAPADNPGPIGYDIFRNGELIAETDAEGYVDRDTDGLLSVTYDVDAVYENGLISPCSTVDLRLPANKASGLTATQSEGGDVKLEWNADMQLTRMEPDASDNYIQTDYPARELEYVHRFRASDLAVYRGYRIRRIAFYPCQSPQTVTCTLRVWSAEPGSTDAKVVSERVLKEFGSTVWNNIVLTKTVEITGDKDIWIGVHTSAPGGVVRLISDKGPAVAGYGNLMRIDGAGWEPDIRSPGNVFCYATLSAPASLVELVEPDFTVPVTDPSLDMFYPVGFAVERDGERIGVTAATSFTDSGVAPGTHTYSVSSLYPGGNESGAVTADIDLRFDGVENVAADALSDEPVRYLDLQGMPVAHPVAGNLYIRIQGDRASKVIF